MSLTSAGPQAQRQSRQLMTEAFDKRRIRALEHAVERDVGWIG